MRKCLVIPIPNSPVEKLAAKWKAVFHLPDPSVLYTLMGAVAANMHEGTPVWLMMVGPPSCGKSELLNSLLGIPSMVEAADIASEAAFLSGSPKRDLTSQSTGGLLRQVGEHGGLILNDFTSVLAKPSDKVSSIMAVFREAYSGRWTRHVGGEGGRALSWTGKLGLYAGCTGKIDQHHQLSAELGERWIYWRYNEVENSWAETMMALSNDRNGWRDDIRLEMATFLDRLDLCHGQLRPRRNYTDSERVRLYELASLAARCRSGVTRDHYSKEIVGAREQERETRLGSVLGQLLIGLDYIGVPPISQWRILSKIALDSMPRLRKMVITACAHNTLSVAQLQPVLGCSLSVVKRVVEDLSVHQVVLNQSGTVALTEWAQRRYSRFYTPA